MQITYSLKKGIPLNTRLRYAPLLLLASNLFLAPLASSAQQAAQQTAREADTSQLLTLQDCINYAIQHQPSLKQSQIGIEIARSTNKIALAQWLPQVNGTGSVTHYIQQPTTFVTNANGQVVPEKSQNTNSVIPAITATQNIFTPSLMYTAKAAPLYIKQAQQATDSTQIELITNVSLAFYNLLQTLEEITVLRSDTALLAKTVSDTYHQWKSGIVDETDYDEAVISLNNSLTQLVQEQQNIVPQYATLKQIMGYPSLQQFNVNYDTAVMTNDAAFDTTEQLQFEKRIEMQQLQTAKSLAQKQTDYYRLAWLPTVSAFFDYDYEFMSSTTSDLFKTAYPYSLVGLNLSIPIFTGFARTQSVHRSKLQQELLDYSEINLKAQIYTDYTTALASYKSNLYSLGKLKDNQALAKRTYDIVALQYNQGVVPYLNLITAQSNLISAQIGYINSLFTLLASKVSLEKAMGDITIKQP